MSVFHATGTRDLKVHVHGGKLYYSDEQSLINEVDAWESLSLDFLEGVDRVFVFGLPVNARLLATMWERQRSTGSPRLVYVASPGISEKKLQRCLPPLLFRHMDAIEYGAGGPGWHRLTLHDRASYALVAEMADNAGQECSEKALALAATHPAYPAVRFIPTHDDAAAARLLACVVDPRWFYDPASGKFVTKLKEYLGVGGGDTNLRMQHYLEDHVAAAKMYRHYYPRLHAAVTAWLGVGQPLRKLGLLGTAVERPEYFLHRLALQHAEAPFHLRILRATRVFLCFLVDVWLDNITPHRELFVPEYFFAEPAAATAWRKFAAVFRGQG